MALKDLVKELYDIDLYTAGADTFWKRGPYIGLHTKGRVRGGPALVPIMLQSLHRGPKKGGEGHTQCPPLDPLSSKGYIGLGLYN